MTDPDMAEYIKRLNVQLAQQAQLARRELNRQLFSDAYVPFVVVPQPTRWQRVSRAVRRYGANWRLALGACWAALRGYYPMNDPDEDY